MNNSSVSEHEREFARVFVGIPLAAVLVAPVEAVQRRMRSVCSSGVKWTRPAQFHLTLSFLGRVPRAALSSVASALTHASAGISPFELALGSFGCFPNVKRPAVFWVGVEDGTARLAQPQKEVASATQEFAEKVETRAFHPHLTLARFRPGARPAPGWADAVERLQVIPGVWPVASFRLYESRLGPQGPEYTVLSDVALEPRG